MVVTVQCDMGCAAAVMAWSSPDHGFAKIHVTTEAPSIPWYVATWSRVQSRELT